ncbi:MAG: ECF transporter S component [candidate division Zixibacteria bacterium]|nr:ECF transporter S component [candidate division Zixibacteria bacterium]
MSFSAKKLALMGVLIALAIALKLPILSVPNVEFFTFIVFSSGYLLGMIGGVVVGIISMSIYTSIITPYGLPPLPIALAQILCMALIGFAGGWAFKFNMVSIDENSPSRLFVHYLVMGVFGLVLAIIYDLFTNLAFAFVIGQFLPVMIAAIPFSLIHVLSNILIFVVFGPHLLMISKIQRGKI